MDLTTLFTLISLAIVLIVVVLLVYFLLGIIIALSQGNKHLYELAAGLGAIEKDTEPLAKKMTTINGALEQLLASLVAVDTHLAAVAKILGR
ncbi:MAG: hypothetical protein HZB51_24720 [Chloroflexi bacterium]|nr:hypothetical protein [Chloroflexota bacterium]